jgi:hypothetical protein
MYENISKNWFEKKVVQKCIRIVQYIIFLENTFNGLFEKKLYKNYTTIISLLYMVAY